MTDARIPSSVIQNILRESSSYVFLHYNKIPPVTKWVMIDKLPHSIVHGRVVRFQLLISGRFLLMRFPRPRICEDPKQSSLGNRKAKRALSTRIS